MNLSVCEITAKVKLLKDLNYVDAREQVGKLIDTSLCLDSDMEKLHKENKLKPYSFNNLLPIAINENYKKDNEYRTIIRTADSILSMYLFGNLEDLKTEYFEVLNVEIKIIPKKKILELSSFTPVILRIKDTSRYWRNCDVSEEKYKNQFITNCKKKYSEFYSETIPEGLPLFEEISFKNSKPISVKIKKVKMLGDSLKIKVADNEYAQNMAYLLIGTGIGEISGRGAGFIDYKYDKSDKKSVKGWFKENV